MDKHALELALARLRSDYASLATSKELTDAVLEKIAALCQGDPDVNTLDKLKAIRNTMGVA